jgi:hypothetical protein
MKESPFKSYFSHFLFFLGYNLYIGISALQKESFYNVIGSLIVVGLFFGLTLLTGHLIRNFLRLKELHVALLTSLIPFLFFVTTRGFDYLAQAAVLPLFYFLVFELTRLGIRTTKNVTIKAIVDFSSRLVPFVVLFHFLLLGIGLTVELPTAYDQFNFLVFGLYEPLNLLALEVSILSLVCYIQIKASNMRIVVSRSLYTLLGIATLLTISLFSYISIKRSTGRAQLEESYLLYEEGENDFVTSTTSEILRADPYNANARFLLGCSLIEQENFQEAYNKFSEITLNPNTGRLTEEQFELVYYRMYLCDAGLNKATDKQTARYSELTPEHLSKLSEKRLIKPHNKRYSISL